ncbi:MAG: 50S ribosomal protein L23 [Arenicellales bacterium]|jgi:large subunit ribosomal protein L23|nr:50S ribosomal protein L23 [Acidiferrobacteraceae bacterium]MDP6123278.1 50S ribosomal protein L23 [Arenicellales bacterium]MBT58241.1 50S ribosomal protein L23 [Acidiferrobacteraceae bacterium]MDP6290041.1 50S ribosomal protein L23 [Arenicellales bacterium]MDP6434006.1 50S ribosomal protein L23 [Arenicellales bacterium]|tara:strand:- start:7743 stop:8042 length:300 start_codon:yes stop_codon:yes gene_type:complete
MNQERIMQTLLSPHVSEKSSILADRDGQVVFKVLPNATKNEIKTAVEQLFDVEVDSVQVVNVRGKVKRFGKTPGKRKNWKKAYVQLKEGHDIDFVGGEG